MAEITAKPRVVGGGTVITDPSGIPLFDPATGEPVIVPGAEVPEEATVPATVPVATTIPELTLAKAYLVNERLGVESQHMVDGESGEEVDNG